MLMDKPFNDQLPFWASQGTRLLYTSQKRENMHLTCISCFHNVFCPIGFKQFFILAIQKISDLVTILHGLDKVKTIKQYCISKHR